MPTSAKLRLFLGAIGLAALVLASAQWNASTLAARRGALSKPPPFDAVALYRAGRSAGSDGASPRASALMDRTLPIFGHKPVAARWRLLLADKPGEGMNKAASLIVETSRVPGAYPGRTIYAAGAALNGADDEQRAFALFLRGLAFDREIAGRNAFALAHYAAVDGLEAMRWHFLTRSLNSGGQAQALLAQARAWATESEEAAAFAEAFEREAQLNP